MCKVLNITRQNYYKYKNKIDKDYYDYLQIKRAYLSSIMDLYTRDIISYKISY